MQSGLWAVEGGNQLIVEKLLENSDVELKLNTEVVAIRRLESGKLKLTTTSGSEKASTVFDRVVLAFPWTPDSTLEIDLKDAADNTGIYHRTVSTFVNGRIAPEAFAKHDDSELPDDIFSINSTTFYHSVARNYPTTYKQRGWFELPYPGDVIQKEREAVYKVFSKKPLTNHESEFIFQKSVAEKVVDFPAAYPEYKKRDNMPRKLPFRIAENVYHTSVIEWAASAMETGAISGRNAALLMFNEAKGISGNIDPFSSKRAEPRTEL